MRTLADIFARSGNPVETRSWAAFRVCDDFDRMTELDLSTADTAV
jgi:hypothetical protein